MEKTLVVLAAGMGSRYGGLKQLDPVGPSGETIIEYSLHDALKAGFSRIVFIIRESFHKEFRERIGSRVEGKAQVAYVFQDLNALPGGFRCPAGREKPWGTGQALYCAAGSIDSPFLIINGDDFYGADAFTRASEAMERMAGKVIAAGMIGFLLENTLSENGPVSRGVCSVDSGNFLTGVTETHGIERKGGYATSSNGDLPSGTVVSMNMWYFTPEVFPCIEKYFRDFLRSGPDDLKSEFYLPAIVNNLILGEGRKIPVDITESQWYGVTYREDRDSVVRAVDRMTGEGVYPKELWF